MQQADRAGPAVGPRTRLTRGLPSADVSRARWPVDVRTRARIARRHFVDQATKVEIGAEFGLTRFQVARVVQDCLDDGTVTITIRGPEHVDDALSDQLVRRLGLADALVVDDLAGAAPFVAAMLGARLADGDGLAVGWSPDVETALAEAGELPRCAVVQACGVSGLDDHGIELVKRVAGACGGEAYPIYAPFRSRTAADATALREHPLVGVATARLERVAAAVLGVAGGPGPGLDHADAAALAAAGAVAALGPVPVSAAGAPVVSAPGERTIGLSGEQLARIPFVLAVGVGPDAGAALAAVAAGDLVHAVVTDTATAREVLARLDLAGV